MQPAAVEFVEEHVGVITGLLTDMVLVGGASIGLWLDEPGAPPARPTNDIDLVIACRSRVEYYSFAERLREHGLHEVAESPVLCRWSDRRGRIFDVMPDDASIIGFSNEWYAEAFTHAAIVELPSGTTIRVATPPYLLAMKFLAFDDPDRAFGGDYLASADMHDIIALFDGRATMEQDLSGATNSVREFLARRLAGIDDRELGLACMNYVSGPTARIREAIIRGRIDALRALT